MSYSHSLATQEANDARSESLLIHADDLETLAPTELDTLIGQLHAEERKPSNESRRRRIRRIERQIDALYDKGEVPIFEHDTCWRDEQGILWA